MYTSVEFIRVENNQPITKESYPEFYFELQRSVLLSLRDSGQLTQMQFRAAEEILENQTNAYMRSTHEYGGNS